MSSDRVSLLCVLLPPTLEVISIHLLNAVACAHTFSPLGERLNRNSKNMNSLAPRLCFLWGGEKETRTRATRMSSVVRMDRVDKAGGEDIASSFLPRLRSTFPVYLHSSLFVSFLVLPFDRSSRVCQQHNLHLSLSTAVPPVSRPSGWPTFGLDVSHRCYR